MSDSSIFAATVPAGFSETIISGPNAGQWNGAVGVTFESNGRMYVWEGGGRVYFKDPGDPSFTLLLNISEEVGFWNDHGMLGFALDPDFRVNGYIYVLYIVDRHHLMNFGTGAYNPNTDDFFSATIGRLTRYTARASDGFQSVNTASRLVLIGETRQTGFPICSDTHGIGSLMFGQDGTLMMTCGDGASAATADTGGAAFASYAPQALADGIIKPKENIGAFRSQLVDCLGGKLIRIDPATGNGVPSNPFFDPANPRSARSRVWALGFRNPFRTTMRPGSGSHTPSDGRPGVFYVGNVGWDAWESLKVVTGPGQNFGWPLYEGLAFAPVTGGNTYDQNIPNQDAPNPLYPAGGCNQYFAFRELLKEDTLIAANFPPFNNPCNAAVKIPSSIPQFLHTRPVLDWSHSSATTLTPTYTSGNATTANVGAGGSPVSGVQFQGSCSVGGTWYTANAFPTQYVNTYFHADWSQGVIKNMSFDANDKPLAVRNFASAAGAVVALAQHPTDGSLYYVSYNYGDAGTVRRLAYTGNRTPLVAASANVYYGPTPLAVQFSSAGSSDPDGNPLTYSWNFGDGSPLSTAANPSHTFTAPAGVPTKFTVSLTVRDPGNLTATTNLIVSVNNTPPNVAITSPAAGAQFSPTTPTIINLAANVSDAQSSDGQLSYLWQTLLHHNDHDHFVTTATNHTGASMTLSPIGCDGINTYYYRVLLTVTDPAGLATTHEVDLDPDCTITNTRPVISDIPNQSVLQGRSTAAIPFIIGDLETDASSLLLLAASSNTGLVPAGNIVFGGSGSNRTVIVTPTAGQTGTSTLTISASDGALTASDTFVLTVSAPVTSTNNFTNATVVTIAATGAATPYPSTINVAGMSGTIWNMTLTLRNLTHQWTPDVDMLLVGPTGQGIIICSDAGNGPVNNLTLTISDAATGALPNGNPMSSGTFKPTNVGAGDTFPAPAPGGTYVTTLSNYFGLSPNGAWSLYIFDDGAGDQGSLAGGWTLSLTTLLGGGGSQPPTISDIANQSTPANTPTAAIPFTIGDAETPAASLTLSRSSSNPTLVPTNNIVFGGSGSNRTVTLTPASGQTGTSTITLTVSDGTNSASDSFVLTVTAVNTPPTITGVPDQIINEDGTAGPLSFTIGDGETAAASLTLGKASSNTALVPTNNIVFGGSGSSRTVTVTPASNASGSATITISVSDGQVTVSTNFLVTVNAVDDAPTVSDIPNQSTPFNTPTAAIPFNVADVDTALASLMLSGDSSNPALVPTNNIVFGGSGGSRTVTVTPITGETGTVTISVSVSDGSGSATDTFVLTVNPPNAPPVISAPADQIINEDTATAPLSFTVGDAETAATSLTLGRASSNPTLIPTNSIVFGGSGSNRTVTVTPVPNQNGAATITISVSDGQSTTSTNFLVTVNAVNDAPSITGVSNQTIAVSASTGPLGFVIGDPETPATSLTLSAGSSDPALVPTNNIAFGGSASNRTVTVTAVADLSGSSVITLVVSDGTNSTATNFTVTVSTLLSGTFSFTNATAITIPVTGAASPYPSTINVSGLGGTASNVVVTLRNLTHTWTRDLDMLLVGPGGQKVLLCSDAGNGGANNVTLTLSNGAASSLPRSSLLTGTYRPANFDSATDVFPAPAPAAPFATVLTAFNGQTPNGVWALYVFDDGNGDLGSLAGGWSLALTAGTGGTANQPPTISDILNQATTVNTPTAALPFTVGDPETVAVSLALSAGSSNPTLVPTNSIVFGGSGSNRTVTVTPASGLTGTSTVTVTVSDGTNSASDTFVLTVNAVNTPPTITGVADQIISEDTVVGPLSFVIGDGETGAASLTLGRSSSNPGLVPTNNIIFGGSGSNRTVTVTPLANQSGSATLTISVNDGQATVSTSFLVTVNAVNDVPTISSVANQNIAVGGTAGPLGFVVGDVESPAASLTVSAGSSNPALVPTSNIVLGGNGSNRTVTVTAVTNQTGSATISLVVSDGTDSAGTSFTVTASALTAGTKSFTNTTTIVIADSGPATPYPSIINVTNLGGIVSNVTMTLRNLSHTWTRDIDILLVGPGGQQALVCSDVGNGGANNVTYTLSDAAASALPLSPLIAGTWRPANYETGDVLAAPAPAGPYTAPLSAFNGQPANGAWSLYVFDDGGGDLGNFAGGWSLTVTTVGGTGDVTNSPTPARLSIVLRVDKGPVVLRLEDASSQSYLIEVSDDLNSWTPLGVVQLVNGSGSFADDDADLNTGRFYRARLAP